MSYFLVLNILLLASPWLPSVFGATQCTIPWHNDANPPPSQLSGYCVPKGDREACPHAALLPATPGDCISTPAESGGGMIEQECCVSIKCGGAAKIFTQNAGPGLAEPDISFCLSPSQTDCGKIGGGWISDALCLGATPTLQNGLICCSLDRPTKLDGTCDTDERIVESCKNFQLDPCCRRLCPDPTQLEKICSMNPDDSCCRKLCPANDRLIEICKLYPKDQCCQSGQPASQQIPLDFPGQNGITATDDLTPADGWVQYSPVEKWQYRKGSSNWNVEQSIPNFGVDKEPMSKEPCPSWRQLFHVC